MQSTILPNFNDSVARIAEIYEASPYQQIQLLDSKRFARNLGNRGMNVSFSDVESLAQLVPPIINKDNHPLWHPYQSWHLSQLLNNASPSIHWRGWIESDRVWVKKSVADFLNRREERLADIQGRSEDFYKLLHLLSIIEPWYIPGIRQKFIHSPIYVDDDHFKNYVAWRRHTSPDDAFEASGMNVAEVAAWHRQLSLNAFDTDDARDWYLLLRRATYSIRDILRGGTRLAHEFYEMAEMLRLLLNDVGQVKLPREDGYIGGPLPEWQNERYGLEGRNTVSRMGLKRLTRDFGLDGSYRGFWYIEGPTEKAFFTKIAQGLGYDLQELGIKLMNLGGVGRIEQIRADARRRLRRANEIDLTTKALASDEVFTYLTIDNDPGIGKVIKDPDVGNLFTIGVRIWKEDFEGGNFEVDELIRAACIMLDIEYESINTQEVERRFSLERKKKDDTGRPKSFGKAFEDVIKLHQGFETFSKGRLWGEALAEVILGQEDPYIPERDAMTALQAAFQMTYADFTLTMEKRGKRRVIRSSSEPSAEEIQPEK